MSESRRREYKPGEECGHPGCKAHISHPCEGCGRYGAGLAEPNYELDKEDAKAILGFEDMVYRKYSHNLPINTHIKLRVLAGMSP